VGIRRDIGDAIALLDAQPLQCRGPAIAAAEKLRVGESQIAVNDRLTASI